MPLYIGTLVLTVIRGGGNFHYFVECGTASFWGVSLAVIPFCLFFCWYYRELLLADPERSNIKWDRVNTVKYPLVCSVAGLFAGLFGVGGGIVKGPLMLAMGVQPKVASATAATMIFFTSSAACVSFAVFGTMDAEYGIPLFCMGFVCTVMGQIVVAQLFKNRQAPIVFSIAVVILVSSLLIGLETGMQTLKSLRDGDLWKIDPLCSTAQAGAQVHFWTAMLN